ncbi:VOC family protein [Sulfitobacter sp. CW3]|uniref:bleomycin resistance protein n=1 Tax=Sulfitobacter sp. CW3 TaxID=2861965 RepID=UPI001C5DDEB7|nr:VOC family protein [Sulfitobacter sp. CW3]MBW4961436.1 VOC family protein [Sulfitobacter sp. CW3]
MTHPHIAALVPELSCSDFKRSLKFYTVILGFEVLFERSERGFAFLALGQAQIMLEQSNGYWDTGPLEHPYGRGINFQIVVPDLQPIVARLSASKVPLFQNPETAWYRIDTVERGVMEILVQDPDGYLLRFSQLIGDRPVAPDQA